MLDFLVLYLFPEDRVSRALCSVLLWKTHIVNHGGTFDGVPRPQNITEFLKSATFPYWATILAAV